MMKRIGTWRGAFRRGQGRETLRFLALLLAAGWIWGCAGAKPALLVDHYSLEYDPPAIEGMTPLDEVLKLNRFSTTEALRGPLMISRMEPYVYYADPYHRWRVNPADLTTDFLARDLRNAGLFKAVFTWRDPVDARFELKGAVEEFSEAGGDGGRRSLLVLRMTLMDGSRSDIQSRVVYQKKYESSFPVEGKNAGSLAAAMSRSMAALSRRIILDAYEAIRQNAGGGKPPEEPPTGK
ncbi:MAG: ABC-type transport auxiliary lipoprotein family protein [Syntrophales bacterium]